MNHQNNSGIQNQPDYHIEIERKNMVRLLDERIDKVYGSLLGPMKKKNIDKIRHFTLDVMVFILDTNPRVCNKLSREIISLAQNTFIEKNVNFSTFNNEQHRIREYMNEVVEYDGLHGITPRYLLFVHLLAFLSKWKQKVIMNIH